jgi:hypothetical protein
VYFACPLVNPKQGQGGKSKTSQKTLYAMLAFIKASKGRKQQSSYHGSKARYMLHLMVVSYNCFLSKLKLFTINFMISLLSSLFSNGLVHYYLVTSPSVDWMFNYLYYASLES